MAFFKIRKGGSDPVAATASPAESVEAMRKRARQRLIGSAVLVLAGVIGFPLVFDTQPRPIAVDIPIEIPDRAKPAARPASAAAPAGPGAVGTVAPGPVASPPPAVFQPQVASPASGPVTPPAPAPAPSVPPAPSAPTRAAAAPASAAAAAQASRAEAPRAASLPASAPVGAPAGPGRFVVQVGAFADPAKAAATRQTLERAGLKTYTHVAETKEGRRIRVRLGPFGTRAEADQAASKVRSLDLPAAVLTL